MGAGFNVDGDNEHLARNNVVIKLRPASELKELALARAKEIEQRLIAQVEKEALNEMQMAANNGETKVICAISPFDKTANSVYESLHNKLTPLGYKLKFNSPSTAERERTYKEMCYSVSIDFS